MKHATRWQGSTSRTIRPGKQYFVKWLKPGGLPPYADRAWSPVDPWPLPRNSATPARSHSVEGRLVKCRNGLHIAPASQCHRWIGALGAPLLPDRIPYLVQFRGDYLPGRDKLVAREARLIRKLRWTSREKALWNALPWSKQTGRTLFRILMTGKA